MLRAAAVSLPAVCKLAPPVDDTAFLRDLEAEGVEIPEDVLALYAALDGFDLSREKAPFLPIFSLLPSRLDRCGRGRATRAVLLESGDTVHLSTCRDGAESWPDADSRAPSDRFARGASSGSRPATCGTSSQFSHETRAFLTCRSASSSHTDAIPPTDTSSV